MSPTDTFRKFMKVRSKTRPYRVDTLLQLRKHGSELPPASVLRRLGNMANPAHHMGEIGYDLAGLGMLAAPSVDTLQAKARAHLSGDTSPDAVKKRTHFSSTAKDLAEVGGLGVLAVPGAIHAGRYLMKRGELETESFRCMLDELHKLGEITPEQAQKSLERYERMQENSPTAGQLARYSAVGAVSGPAADALRSVVKGEQVFKPATHPDTGLPVRAGRLRSAASRSAAGALVSGAIPVVRHVLDQRAEEAKLRQFMGE